MAVVTDCSPEEALWLYHEQALAVATQQFQKDIDAVGPAVAAMDSAISGMQDTLDGIFGADDDAACSLPRSPTQADIEASISSKSLAVVNGHMILPGTLSLTAFRRLYSIFGSLNQIGVYMPEVYVAPTDPDFGKTGVTPRLMVIELQVDTTETTPNPCAPDDVVVTSTEVLVGVDKRVSEDDSDRVIVCVWIGAVDVNDSTRNRMVDLGLTDTEIVDLALTQSQPRFEVYTVPDPYRVWQYLTSFQSDSVDDDIITDTVGSVLNRGLDSVNDAPTTADVVSALRDAISTAPVGGCGVPPAIGLLATMDTNSMFTSDSECDANVNIYGPVNDVIGAMGSIQRAIDKTMSSFQAALGKQLARLASFANDAERKFLGRGLLGASVASPGGSIGASVDYLARSRSEYASPLTAATTLNAPTNRFTQNPNNGVSTSALIPSVPQPPFATLDQVQAFTDQLNSNMLLITNTINSVSQIVVGMSLLMCSMSQFGNIMNTAQPNIGGSNHLFRFARPECTDTVLQANIDMSGLSFDILNQAIQMLLDVLHRLISLLNSLIRAENSGNSLFQLNCNITETAQLAAATARQLAAHNWGRF